jgi:hypothetical protein
MCMYMLVFALPVAGRVQRSRLVRVARRSQGDGRRDGPRNGARALAVGRLRGAHAVAGLAGQHVIMIYTSACACPDMTN